MNFARLISALLLMSLPHVAFANSCVENIERNLSEGWLTPLDLRFVTALIIMRETKRPVDLSVESLNEPRRALLDNISRGFERINHLRNADGTNRDLAKNPLQLYKDDLIVVKSVFTNENKEVRFVSGGVIRVESFGLHPENWRVFPEVFMTG